jgi:predicted nucleic acid-binding protein
VSELVVDASVVAKWYVNEEDSALADLLIHSKNNLYAPALILTELANIFWKRHVRFGVPVVVWSKAKLQLDARISISQSDASVLDMAFELAVDNRHPVYDCLYLALAMDLNCQVVTADRRFASVFSDGATQGRVILLDDWAALNA